MRIVVLGAKGRLGSYLVPHLLLCEHEVLCLSRTEGDDWCVDLTDFGEVSAALDKMAPDVIVNLAAQTNIDECEMSPHSAYLANVKIVENLAKWIENSRNLTHLVQLSTDQLYDSHGPHKEDDIALAQMILRGIDSTTDQVDEDDYHRDIELIRSRLEARAREQATPPPSPQPAGED